MTLTIDISSNVAYLHKFMEDFERKHLPYAISRTINDIAVMGQERIDLATIKRTNRTEMS